MTLNLIKNKFQINIKKKFSTMTSLKIINNNLKIFLIIKII